MQKLSICRWVKRGQAQEKCLQLLQMLKKSDAMQRKEQNKTLDNSRTCERELDDDVNLFRREPAR
jgi:hypothetical protein